MATERNVDYGALVRAYIEAQERMAEDGCPNGVPRSSDIVKIAMDLAKGSARTGLRVRNGAIASADIAASKAAERHGPRIPGTQGNGKA